MFFDNGAKTSIEGSSNLHLSSIGALSKEISLITPSESLLYEFGLLGTLLFPFTNITQKNFSKKVFLERALLLSAIVLIGMKYEL